MVCRGGLAGECAAGNAFDVGAADADVAEFAGTHAAEFCDGLAVLAPVVERACYVHDNPLSGGCVDVSNLFSVPASFRWPAYKRLLPLAKYTSFHGTYALFALLKLELFTCC